MPRDLRSPVPGATQARVLRDRAAMVILLPRKARASAVPMRHWRGMLWFVLALGSALFQVLRNMVMKRLGHALDETINVWGRFTFILPFAAGGLLVNGVPPLQPGVWLYCFLFALTQIAGTQFLALALNHADISLVTALWKLSLLLLVAWGVLALGESPSALGVTGVVVSAIGVYLLNVNRARVSVWAPLVALIRDPGQRYTLGAAFFFAPSVVFIKKIALLSSPTFAVFMGYVFCAAIITPFAIYRSGRHFRQIGRHWWSFVGLGAFAAISTWLGTAAYTMTVSSYVEAVKQLELVMALAIGYLVFGEGARIRTVWLGCVVMLIGLVLLVLGG